MFQVASHPTTFSHPASWVHDDLSPVTSPARNSFNNSDIQLPRTLTRPTFSEVSRDQIAAVAPELANVPAEYIRQTLAEKTPRMQAGIQSCALPQKMSKGQVSQQGSRPIAVQVRPSSNPPTYPSHLLALTTSSKVQSTSDEVILVPTHSIVLAAHCPSLPRMPPACAQTSASAVNIPILPLSVPSPAAFPTLHSFLYTHSTATLLAALLPGLPPAFLGSVSASTVRATLASGPKLHQLSAHLVGGIRGSRTQVLMSYAQHINCVWRNTVALGVHDADLWDALDLAWEIVLGSLNLAAGAR
ncbi:hypothetical protein HWV62_41334 [Athelia sp. TMB]|nr:hypothetical protein HWV62_41334 [Athelia sp. TMB]